MSCGGALLEGTVYERQEGRPLAGARVVLRALSGSAASPASPATCDRFGRFSFSQLPEGYYLLSAQKPGYAHETHGQSRWNGAGRPILLKADDRLAVELRLQKLGVLTGEILDENRVGIPDYPVLVYSDEKPLRLAGQILTDDRGMFRIASLNPGRYQVRSGPKQLEDGAQFLPTWFGGTLEASQPVEARLDSETSGIRITPIGGKLLRLAGSVAWPASSVTLYSELGARATAISGSGAFVFDALSPGNYELTAESAGAKTPLAAYRKFYLDRDVEGIVLEPSPAPRLEFSCVWKSRGGTYREITATLRRTSPGEAAAHRLTCYARDVSLSPGIWEVTVSAPRTVLVHSFETVERPLAANQFTAMPGSRVFLAALLSSKPASLRGKVLTSDGQPAIGVTVLLSASAKDAQWRLAGRDVVRTDDKGEYQFDGLPPGDFRVLATMDYQRPEQVDWSEAEGVSVHLEEGESELLNMRLKADGRQEKVF